MKNNSFNENYKNGCEAENFLKRIFKVFKRSTFLAGNNGNTVVNTLLIERMYHCEYLPAGEYFDNGKSRCYGPRLKFGDVILTMPDLLFSRSVPKEIFWLESKSSRNSKFSTIDVSENDLLSYMDVERHSRNKVWIALVFIDTMGNVATVFSAGVSELLDYIRYHNFPTQYNEYYQEDVYRLDPAWKVFNRIYYGEYP